MVPRHVGSSVLSTPPWLRSLQLYTKRYAIVATIALYLAAAAIIASKLLGAPSTHHNLEWRLQALSSDSSSIASQTHHHLRASNGVRTAQEPVPPPVGEVEIWARVPARTAITTALRNLLGVDATQELRSLCGRCLYRTLTSYVRVKDHGRFSVVLTGDIAAMWLRDSAVQMASYIPRVARRPALRQTLEGAIRAQAYFILQVNVVDRIPSLVASLPSTPSISPRHMHACTNKGSLGQRVQCRVHRARLAAQV